MTEIDRTIDRVKHALRKARDREVVAALWAAYCALDAVKHGNA